MPANATNPSPATSRFRLHIYTRTPYIRIYALRHCTIKPIPTSSNPTYRCCSAPKQAYGIFRTARATGRFLMKRSGQSTGAEHTVCSFQDYPINIQKNQRLQHDYTNEQAYTEITTEKNKTSRCRSTNQAKPVQRHPRARHKAKAHEIPRTYRTSGHRNEKARQIHGRSRKEPS